ncbi:MAG: HupE/UreJ family protein, partial [Steroidobacteraceae bacterium]
MSTSCRRSTAAAMLCILALCVLAGAARPAHADARTLSYSTWVVSSGTVMLRYVLPVSEAQRLTGVDIPVATVERLGEYVLRHTAVSASGRDCPAIDQGYDLGKVDPVRAGPGLYGFEIFFRCGGPMRDLVLENRALFGRVPAHVDFARIEAGGHFTQQIFTAERQQLKIESPAAVQAAGLGAYLRLGALHILHSADRLCLLLAVLLLARRRRDVPWIVAALAAGYGLSWLARGAGLIAPHEALLDAFAGFLVVLCAVAIAIPQLERPRVAIIGWTGLLLLAAVAAAVLRAVQPALLLGGAAGLSAGFLVATHRPGHWRGLWLLPAGVLGFLDGFVLP